MTERAKRHSHALEVMQKQAEETKAKAEQKPEDIFEELKKEFGLDEFGTVPLF